MNTLTLNICNHEQLQHGLITRHRFDRRGGTIGSRGADWVLIDPGQAIEPIHCEIRWIEGSFCAIDRCHQTYLNNTLHSLGPRAPVRLQEGDQLRIGAYRLRVHYQNHPSSTGSLETLFVSNQRLFDDLLDDTATGAWSENASAPDAPTAGDICAAFEPGIGVDPLAALDAAPDTEHAPADALHRLITGAPA
ncbi:hypothetical protein DM813_22615 [Pseudomonas alkylphenolica]|uniref:FHA domain-containing protein n=1 Tax=Pseudomonas alkylphenolica TaxID=237609 RepID=A0A443ZJJ8_9PSED|nr:FHA domain-containing protein [Pseudomonas alkylphenolica]RWU19114.1 hypothetical protein DM813_22615 [Pseudomonas alkylphenolica]